ncbi:MAG: ferritin family protein [Candidatus Bipolaricaulota bacterium]|nr:MAG: ferritin family protein [Candidatus Bipolaricaulota bacterium]
MSMSLGFTVNEVLLMAERIERNGAAFYRAAASNTDRPVLKARLEELAAMEDAHREVFTAMAEELASADPTGGPATPTDEAAAYLRAMADAAVFDDGLDPEALAAKMTSGEELLRTAIHIEKETILFYLGLRDFVVGADGRERLDRVLREEMEHVSLLKRQLTALE